MKYWDEYQQLYNTNDDDEYYKYVDKELKKIKRRNKHANKRRTKTRK
jgi:hypothetical protein